MSLATTRDDEPRRGTRARKRVERYEPANGKTRSASNSDDEQSDAGSDNDPTPRKRKATKSRKAADGAPAKKKTKAAPPKAATLAAPVTELTEGFKTDSPLFNALLNADIALQPLAEDWVQTYQGAAGDADTEKAAVHELVLFFVRACGLGTDVDENEAMDQDGVNDTVERIQDESVNTNAAAYPLISRLKHVRPLKNNLSSIVSHLVSTLSLTPHLFDDAESTKHSVPLMPLLLAWLLQMSVSPLRPIRHTGTFIALKLNTALCAVAATASNELSIKQRQKDAEVKKGGSGAAVKKRIKEAESKVKEAHTRKTVLEEYMQEIFSATFVHRVRDADPAIRGDCIRELGVWVKKYPEMYLQSQYLSYFVRGTNDPNDYARLETVKSLSGIFSNAATATNASSFSLRLAPRLIQMAALDVDGNIRTHALSVITQIDKTGALEDEDEDQRATVARLIFDEYPRIRKAAAPFVKGLWEERAEKLKSEFGALRDGKKKRAAKVKDTDLDTRFEWKALAQLLVETADSLETPSEAEAGSSSQPVNAAAANGSSSSSISTRAAAAADALYPHIELLQDWHALADYLLLDHSTAETDPWLLNEEEEDFMLEMLITSIRREEDDEEDAKSKALMKVLPRLFAKHHAEVSRIVGVLSIPEHMNLGLYLDMRKTSAYEALWDDVTKQFLQHTDAAVLSAAIQTINALNANESMAATNTQKLVELEDALFTSLRDAVNGEDVPAMSISEDQLSSIEAILLRITLLARSRDIVTTMEDEEGGQSSGWTIVLAFAGRGALGFKDEAKLVEHALQIIFLHVAWLFKRFTEADAEDATAVAALRERRDEALETFETFGVRSGGNAAETVRRQAFIAFINLYILFSNRSDRVQPAVKACALEMASDKQHKLGGAFQSVTDRYLSDLEEEEIDPDDVDELSVAAAQRQVVFLQMVSVFVGAIRCGVLDVEQAREPLAYCGRFDATYDAIVKKLVDVLRDEGIYNRDATTVQHVIGEALQSSFSTFLEKGEDEDEPTATISLARLAATAFIVHGTHFTVLKQIHPDDVYDLHISALDWMFKQVRMLVKQQATKGTQVEKQRVVKQLAQLLTYLRPLTLLLGPLNGKYALRVRGHLEKAVDDSGLPAKIRSSSSYKAYEKRLVTGAGKDSELKVPAPAKAAATTTPKASAKSAETIEDMDDEENLEAGMEEIEELEDERQEENGEADDVVVNGTADTEDLVLPDEIVATEDEVVEVAEDPVQTDEEASAAEPTANGNKRAHPDDEDDDEGENENGDELPELDMDVGGGGIDLEMSAEIDLGGAGFDSPSSPAGSADRDRSVSVEPNAKRRKTVKKF